MVLSKWCFRSGGGVKGKVEGARAGGATAQSRQPRNRDQAQLGFCRRTSLFDIAPTARPHPPLQFARHRTTSNMSGVSQLINDAIRAYANSLCSSSEPSTSKSSFAHNLRPSTTDHGLQRGPPQQHHHVVHCLRRRIRYAIVCHNEHDLGTQIGRELIQDNRAFDTGSEKIWDSINRGVRLNPRFLSIFNKLMCLVATMEGHQEALLGGGRGRGVGVEQHKDSNMI